MGLVVVSGAKLMCPFGTAPSTLTTTSQVNCMGSSKPIATITDTSMTPFGMCVYDESAGCSSNSRCFGSINSTAVYLCTGRGLESRTKYCSHRRKNGTNDGSYHYLWNGDGKYINYISGAEHVSNRLTNERRKK